MLVVDVNGLNIFESSELPFAARIHKHRPDRNVVVTQASVIIEERKRALRGYIN